MIRRRMGRPGLLGTVARTAVVAGTASAVSGRVQRGAAERSAGQQALAEQQAMAQQPVAPPAPAAPAQDRVSQLTALADLKAQGVLTEAEFESEKARILNG